MRTQADIQRWRKSHGSFVLDYIVLRREACGTMNAIAISRFSAFETVLIAIIDFLGLIDDDATIEAYEQRDWIQLKRCICGE